jgi:hypothetical protein
MSREDHLNNALTRTGVYVRTYSPGDGMTRYRFFSPDVEVSEYFGPSDGMHTALGFRDAKRYALGVLQGFDLGRKAHELPAD